VLGIGNELWGDDAAGSRAARLIQQPLSLKAPNHFLMIDAGPVPENFSGVLRRFQPHYVLMMDAVRASGNPGRIRWIEFADLDGVSALTHGMPLSVLGQFLESELGALSGLLGIEGENFELGSRLSSTVNRSVNLAARDIRKLIQDIDQNLKP
jgi:hydrogenase 3 maturation protease